MSISKSSISAFLRASAGLLACCAALLLGTGAARAAERRVALVIGNSSYQQAPALSNPKNDAQDMALMLREVGFEVIEAIDVDKRGMDNSLANFNRAAKGAGVALFYFAGHGLQYNGSNYILPVDAKLEDDVGLRYEAVSLDQVRAAVDEASAVKIMILDACRNNPLAGKLARSVAGNSRALPLTRGLARIEQTTGTVVAYATQANQVAEDGGGRNSPFTLALIENMREPGVEIASLFRRVANSVHERTQGRQVPELSISLLNDFYLNQRESDMQAWDKARASTDAASLRDFVARFPSSLLADAARARLDVVERAERDGQERFARDEGARLAREARAREIREKIATLQQELDIKPAPVIVAAAPAPVSTPPPSPPVEARRIEVIAAPPAAPQTLAALTPLPTQAQLPARTLSADDPRLFALFRSEMRRLGCYAAANGKDWDGAPVKQALSLYAKQASLAGAPARLDGAQFEDLQKRKARLCPSLCNARQNETGAGRCIAKTCGRGEILDADGDCVDRPVVRRLRSMEKPVARRNPVVERPVARAAPRRRRVREDTEYVERRPRRTVEEPVVEARQPCSSGPSIGIGFGPIRLAAPLGRRC